MPAPFAATPAGPPPGASARLLPIDAMRGLIMVLMAIDHASYFVARRHSSEFWGVDLPRYEAALPFVTRLVTHLCAPGFFLVMGVGMALFAVARVERAGWSGARVSRFFVSRGLLLIVLQHAIENPAWVLGEITGTGMVSRGGVAGGGSPLFLHFGVLYGLGATMVVWGLLLRLPGWAIAAIGAAAIFATQLLLPPPSDAATLYSPLVRLLLVPGHSDAWQVFYPLVPWLGVTGFGLLLGRALARGDARRVLRRTTMLGGALLGAFAAIRLGGGFGNFHAPADGWIGFLNVTKYPPSLAFLTLTLGVDLLLLGALAAAGDALRSALARPLLVFGRTALFFYLLHLWVYLAIGLLAPNGTSVAMTYPAWLLGLAILYPVCVRYERFRSATPADSLWRFF